MPELTDDEKILREWVGRRATSSDFIDSRPANLMKLLLDKQGVFNKGDALPGGWHWLYFIEGGRQSELGRDGHMKLGKFLPPVSLPRRMWAGGRLEFSDPLRIGDVVDKFSLLKNVSVKDGRSGKLCFVTVEHSYKVNNETRITEIHDIVYRDKPNPDAKPATATEKQSPDWTVTVEPDPVMLFRYSALTFNGHRIHYDRDFCLKEENYPGLVFHGPLTATMLLDQAVSNHPDKIIKSFSYKAISPLFDISSFTLNGKSSDDSVLLWASDADSNVAMRAELCFL